MLSSSCATILMNALWEVPVTCINVIYGRGHNKGTTWPHQVKQASMCGLEKQCDFVCAFHVSSLPPSKVYRTIIGLLLRSMRYTVVDIQDRTSEYLLTGINAAVKRQCERIQISRAVIKWCRGFEQTKVALLLESVWCTVVDTTKQNAGVLPKRKFKKVYMWTRRQNDCTHISLMVTNCCQRIEQSGSRACSILCTRLCLACHVPRAGDSAVEGSQRRGYSWPSETAHHEGRNHMQYPCRWSPSTQ